MFVKGLKVNLMKVSWSVHIMYTLCDKNQMKLSVKRSGDGPFFLFSSRVSFKKEKGKKEKKSSVFTYKKVLTVCLV